MAVSIPGWAALLSFLFAGGLVHAAALSLGEAEKIARERNADIRAAREDVETARGAVRSAQQLPNPTATLTVNKVRIGRTQTVGQGANFFHRNYDQSGGLAQLIEVGKRGPRQRAAAATLLGAEARLRDAQRQVVLAVTKAFVGALQADAQAGVLQASAALLRREAGIAEARFEAGDISKADRAQIEVAASRLELDACAAAANAQVARIQLQTLLGVSRPDGKLALAGPLAALIPAGAGSDDFTERADIVAARFTLARSEADFALERAQQIPDPIFSIQYERELPDTPHSLGFSISVPLPLPGYRAGERRAAAAAVRQAKVALDRVQTQAAADLASARTALNEASRRAQAYRGRIVPEAERVREAVAYAFSRGGASLTDLLAAQRASNEVRAAAVQAEADAAVAAAALRASRGERGGAGNRRDRAAR